MYRLWPDAAKYGNISETAWRWSSQFALRSTLTEVRRMLTISMYCNHNTAARLVPLVWSRWVLARWWMTSSTPVALTSSTDIFFSINPLNLRWPVWCTFWPGTVCMRSMRSLLAQLIPWLPFSRRVTTSFTLSSDFWQIGQDFARSHTSFFFLTFLFLFLIFPADFNMVDSCSREKKRVTDHDL